MANDSGVPVSVLQGGHVMVVNADGSINTTGGGGGGAMTVADGADVAEGATTDVAVTGDTAGTVSAKLRGLNKILFDVWSSGSHWLAVSIQNATLAVTQSGAWVLSAGAAIIGKVGIDQTTPGTTNAVAATNLPTTVDTNSGNKSASTLRVVLATDQPALTNKLLVTPDSVALPANQSVNVAQINGVTPLMGAGNTGTGSPRVTIATDQVVIPVGGDVAHDGVDSGNPVKIGGKAGTTFPAAVSAGDRTNLLTDVYGRPFTRHGAQGPSGIYVHKQHNPAANTKATISLSAGAAGVRNVCTGLTVSLASSSTTAPAAIQVTVALIDGAAGGTTYLWGPTVIALPAVAGAVSAFVLGQCWKPGTAATAMTLEFSAAGGANTIESVSFDSTTVAE